MLQGPSAPVVAAATASSTSSTRTRPAGVEAGAVVLVAPAGQADGDEPVDPLPDRQPGQAGHGAEVGQRRVALGHAPEHGVGHGVTGGPQRGEGEVPDRGGRIGRVRVRRPAAAVRCRRSASYRAAAAAMSASRPARTLPRIAGSTTATA